MMVEKRKKAVVWAVLLSESMHIFCCVLPTIFTVMSLMAGAGMIAVMPAFVDDLHHLVHDYEVPMIIASGFVLALGWGLHLYSKNIDCSEGQAACSHEPCGPKKDKLQLLMIAATILFAVNVIVYTVFHRGMDAAAVEAGHEGHDDHGHDGHDH